MFSNEKNTTPSNSVSRGFSAVPVFRCSGVFRGVPGCSGCSWFSGVPMFRCSGVFRGVPVFLLLVHAANGDNTRFEIEA